MRERVIAVGDILGHSAALKALIAVIQPTKHDTVVFLGDYVDRGPDSAGVIQTVIDLKSYCLTVALKGNHEEMFLDAWNDERSFDVWIQNGGDKALASYGGDLSKVPTSHREFLEQLPRFHETENHFFIHANYAPNWRLEDHDSQTAFWMSLSSDVPMRHYSGKTAILGHTAQMNGKILELGYLKCIDTGCGFGGCLTGLDVMTGDYWQVDELGNTIQR